LNEVELVIMIGRDDNHEIANKLHEHTSVIVSAYDVGACEAIELVLPMASHLSRAGSFINKDGYVQHSACAIALVPEHQPLLMILVSLLAIPFLHVKRYGRHFYAKKVLLKA